MIRDEDLKSYVDYSEGQKEAAYEQMQALINLIYAK